MRKSFNLLRKIYKSFPYQGIFIWMRWGSSINPTAKPQALFLNCTSGRWGKNWASLWPCGIYTPVLKTSGLMNMQWAMMKILESLEKLDCWAKPEFLLSKQIVMKFPGFFLLFWGQWLDISSSKLSFGVHPSGSQQRLNCWFLESNIWQKF